MRKFKIEKAPFGEEKIFCKSTVTFKPGVTVLTGCNGAGKTTLLRAMKRSLNENHIPIMSIDNLKEGSYNFADSMMYHNQIKLAASMVTASEGEGISLTLGYFFRNVDYFICTGIDKLHPLDYFNLHDAIHMHHDEYMKEKELLESRLEDHKERWLLFDACDSGLSIDMIADLKEVFDLVLSPEGTHWKDVYIIVTANSYEMAANQNCYDVAKGQFYVPTSYEEYKDRILESRKIKNNR